eukprot:3667716-Amphidinium_carterae.1
MFDQDSRGPRASLKAQHLFWGVEWCAILRVVVPTGKDVGQGLERWSVLAGMVVAAVVLAALTKNTGHNDWLADHSKTHTHTSQASQNGVDLR